MDTTRICVVADTQEQAEQEAAPHLEAFYADRPYVVTDVSARATMSVSGHVLHWDVDITATGVGT